MQRFTHGAVFANSPHRCTRIVSTHMHSTGGAWRKTHTADTAADDFGPPGLATSGCLGPRYVVVPLELIMGVTVDTVEASSHECTCGWGDVRATASLRAIRLQTIKYDSVSRVIHPPTCILFMSQTLRASVPRDPSPYMYTLYVPRKRLGMAASSQDQPLLRSPRPQRRADQRPAAPHWLTPTLRPLTRRRSQ